jgi:hypothetical protein
MILLRNVSHARELGLARCRDYAAMLYGNLLSNLS